MLVGFAAPVSINHDYNLNNILSEQIVSVADTGDTLQYPIKPEQEGGLYLTTPRLLQKQFEYDPETGQYVVSKKLGEHYITPPAYMTQDEYRNYIYNKQIQDNWKEKVKSTSGARDAENSLLIQPIDVGGTAGKAIGSIFGSNTIDIRPQGSAELTFSGIFQTIDNPALPETNRNTSTFNFDERLQINVTGKIGDKLQLTTNFDTEATFSFENQMKLEYTGDEDEIIQKIELGNVSLPLNSSLITGSQGLFGVKGQFKFGRLTATAVFSEQRTERSTTRVEGGATLTDFNINVDEYEANRHYFLGHYFRDNYDRALAALPIINSGVNISKIEVWVTNRNSTTSDVRNIVALQDLGEPDRIHDDAVVFPIPGNRFPNNGANNLYQFVTGSNQVRDISTSTDFLTGQGLTEATSFTELENARKLSPTEFTFHPQLGYISLNQSLNQDEVLAVAYQYTLNGQTFQVGEFSNDGINAPQSLVVKMLKSTITNVKIPLWDLMMKNVYSIGAYQLNSQDFRLDIVYANDATGTPINYIPEGGDRIKNQILLRVMNLDNLNVNNDPQPDGFFDFVNGLTVNSQNGRIYFPVVEPFGSHLRAQFDDAEIASKYVFQELYDSTKFVAQQNAELNKFRMMGEYKSSSSSEIALGAFNIPKNSVTVTAAGRQLTENVDYTVDYNLGRVTILNDALLSSGTPIDISVENNTLFNFQTKRFMGVNLDYKISEKWNVGSTILNLSERPLTQKTNIGEEPISNTIIGVNTTYSTEAPGITRLVDKIPFIDTKEKSTVTFTGEYAKLIPGSPRGIDINGSETSFIDDFESAQTSIDIRNRNSWVLASTPQGQADLFPEAEVTNNIVYNYNRAKLAWYTIDPLFHRNSDLTPSHISDNPSLVSTPYTREVLIEEIFPNISLQSNQPSNVAVLDLAYYPSLRGPYNFDVEGSTFSSGLAADGTLVDPESRWAGIMRTLTTNNFEESNVEFIQFWVMDPFLENPNHPGGDLYFNLGSVSEDILRDGRKSFEQGLPTTANVTNVDTTNWGWVSTLQSTVNAFSNEESSRPFQDVGLDGLTNAEEIIFSGVGDSLPNYLNRISATLGPGSQAFTNAQNDPSADDFQYYRSSTFDNQQAGVLRRYRNFNGTENNSPVAAGDIPNSSTTLPDQEDINRDQTLSKTEAYFQYKVSMRPQDMVVGQNYITDKITTQITLADGNQGTATWYQFKIPIFEPDRKVGAINDFRSIRFMRMFLKDFDREVVLRFARLELIRGEWRRYELSLKGAAEGEEGDENSNTEFDVTAVNIEENGNRVPIPYVLPPGIDRQVLFGTSSLQQQNEQALSLRVCELEDGDARAAFKNLALDIRTYNRMRMYVHAEAGNDVTLPDGQITAFIRIGSDYTQNYYEYEIPLDLTDFGTDDPDRIWPSANEFNFSFDALKETKLERDRFIGDPGREVSRVVRYTRTLPGTNHKVSVIGSPNLGNVRTIMIGVRNPANEQFGGDDNGMPICAEVWFNELRLSDFDEDGGWAATARVTTKMADFANVTLAGSMSTVGFGSLDQGVTERIQEERMQYNLSSNVEVGKFFPKKSGIKIPLFYSVSEEVNNPRFDPLDPDIEFEDKLNNLETEAERDSLKSIVQDYTKRTSINLTNVRKERDPTKQRKPMPYDVENLSATFSRNESFHRDINTEFDRSRDTRVSLAYNWNHSPPNVQPLKNVKFLQSPYLALIRDFNFYYLPSRVSVRSDVNRMYNERLLRNLDNPGLRIDTTFNKSFTMDRIYDVKFDLSKALKIDYSARANTRIDEPEGRIDTEEKKDSLWDNFWDLGRTTNFHQTTRISYALPVNKIPLTDWITSTVSYNSDYDWRANTLATQQIDSVDLDFGNTIQNANTKTLTGQFNMVSLYNKVGYLKRVNQGISKRPQPQRQRNEKAEGEGEEGEEEEEEDEGPSVFEKVLEGGAKFLMSVKNVSFNYSETNGTLLPGFKGTPEYIGLGNVGGTTAPTFGFVFGDQTDIRNTAVERDWLVKNPLQNGQFSQTHSQNLNIRSTIEPLKNFRIELTATRTFSENHTEFFRYDTANGNNTFVSQNPQDVGNFSMSFYTLPTAFVVDDDVTFDNKTFQQFLDNRRIIANRLAAERGITIPTDSFPDGFSSNSQEVLLPAFLAAYTGNDAGNYTLQKFPKTPKPNWRITYTGLTNIKWVRDRFKSVNLTSGYRSVYTVGSYNTNLLYEEGGDIRDVNGDFLPEIQILQVGISEQFSPLFKVDVTMNNSITANVEFKRDRTLNLSFANNQLTEIKGNEIIVGGGYRIPNVKFKVNGKTLNSDLDLKADIKIRRNRTLIRKIEEETNQVTTGQTIVTIKISADYAISKRFNLRLFFDRIVNNYDVSSAFPTTNTQIGITARLTLGP